jgi:protein SCO1/2/putative membrane protein
MWALFIGAAACAVAALVGVVLRRGPDYPRAPEFRVIERSGKPLTKRDLRGQVWVADFVFARCPTACPVMNSVAYELRKRLPELKVVTFSVDPAHDTPEFLNKWVGDMGLAQEGWYWGSGLSEEGMQAVAKGFLQAAGRDEKHAVVHSERFVVVDRFGRIRDVHQVLDPETFAKDPSAVDRLAAAAAPLLREPTFPLKLPKVNAALNALSGVCLLAGLGFIKRKRIGVHKAFMLAALSISTLFLLSYLTAHKFLGSTPYAGGLRPLYLGILLSHTVLAAVIVPLAGITVYQAFSNQIDRHRGWAKWTFPLWLYVSVTGVVIYFMLY